MKSKKNPSKSSFRSLVIVLTVILILILSFSLFLKKNTPLQTKEINIKGIVGDHLGMSASSVDLDFGMTLPGSPVGKTLSLSNQYLFPVMVEVIISPNLSNLVYGTNDFLISPGETYNYSVSFFPSENASFGNYSGKITFNFYPA